MNLSNLEKLLEKEKEARKFCEEKIEQQSVEIIDLKKKLLIEAKELREFTVLVSHDLKSPLRNISALLSWLKEDLKDLIKEDDSSKFDLIGNDLLKMDNLISGMTVYSNLSSDLAIDRKIDLNELIRDLVEYMEIPENVSILFKNDFPSIKINKIRIQELFKNLIYNAVYSIDKKEGLVEIEFEEQEKFYQFSVKDNGVGIDSNYQDKIFDTFQSLSNQTGSAGIGLSIVKKIVDLYGGEIWVESELDKGSTFYFTISKV